ncbi:MAG: CDP-alcohol phosphatidyltransferase family protein [Bacteroidales bacterium]|nr:CDP-alcohol phosphatidyltransferase family protein [Bacteroidales bacterium]
MKKNIPNTITLLNMLCGVIATVCAVSGLVKEAAFLIFAGAIFDYFDGFFARLLHVSSPIGKELDSFADVVSFAIAPAAIYSTYVKYLVTGDWYINIYYLNGTCLLFVIMPFVLALFGALRLAKFNLDDRQTENFLGLTTTATGLFTASLMIYIVDHLSAFKWVHPWMILMMIFIFCVLLVSEVPMFSLKIKHLTFKGNELRVALVLIGLVSILFLGWGGIALTILLYVIFSLVNYVIN